jgi:hypothetical protein
MNPDLGGHMASLRQYDRFAKCTLSAGPALNAASRSEIGGLEHFPEKVDTGFPLENATNKEQLERFPIQPDREAL